jgi:hypothetical protein
MKKKMKVLVKTIGLLSLCLFPMGCIVHEHSHARPHHYHHGPVAHVHGPGCGHALRGGVWIAIP